MQLGTAQRILVVALAVVVHLAASLSTATTRHDFIKGGLGAAAAAAALVSPSQSQAAAGSGTVAPLPFVQHAVLRVSDMDESVKFWKEGLGMQVVRSRQVGENANVFMAYGPETLLQGKNGGYFSLELVKEKGKRPGPVGTSFQYFGLTLPIKPKTLAYQVTDAGGSVVPHWFSEKNYVEVASPDGIRVRVNEGKRRDPVTCVAFGTANTSRFKSYLTDSLGMREQRGGLAKFLGPLAGDELLGYDAEGVSIAVVSLDSAPSQGDAFGKVAIITSDIDTPAKSVASSSSGKVLFSGPVPGIGTKVTNTLDDEGHGFVFVDYEDFEGELVPQPPPADQQ